MSLRKPRHPHKLKFAAIDVGTNAARLLLTNVYFDGPHPVFKKIGLYRIPLQLGDDVFSSGQISPEKADKLCHTIHAFAHLLQVYRPIATMACATSAMREAQNGHTIAQHISRETGITLQIIDGKLESEFIYLNHLSPRIGPEKNVLTIDVGGGSTEISFFSNQKVVSSKSFKIGTLRMLNHWVDETEWGQIKQFLKSNLVTKSPTLAIGTGGNISKALSLSGPKSGDQTVSRKKLEKLLTTISAHSIKDRIIKLGLKPDRAEVIVPALEVYIRVMKMAKIGEIVIPKVGLSDGIIHHLFNHHIQNHDIPFTITGD